AVQTFRGAQHTFELGQTLSGALKALSQGEGATLYMTLLAGFQVLLNRYSGQADIVVGSPMAGRNRAEIEPLIGFFINTLVLRTQLSGEMTFRQVLSRVREVCLGAYAHQDVPFEILVEKLQPDRDLSRNPFFQVVFQLLKTSNGAQQPSASSQPSLEINVTTSKFDLTFDLWETTEARELAGQIEYNTDLFDEATIERLARHYRRLLESIVAHSDQPISQLSLLSAGEERQLVREWNQTATDYPRASCIHELFEAQVERSPERVAVIFEDQQLSYGELNRRANQLAGYLQQQGVGVETLVGVMVERSVELVISLLGVLKAGGAYVPLDASYPAERLQYMMADAGVAVVITQSGLAPRLAESGVRVVSIDGQWPEIEQQSAANVASSVRAENLAYVIYTSGSTGKPKGVSIPHRAINRLVSNTNYIKIDPSDRTAQASNASFDAATFEIWGTLLHGAQLVGISRDVALSAYEFAVKLREHQITILFLTTSLFNQLVSEVPEVFGSLRHLLFGGSAVDPRWVKEVLQKAPSERLLHVYGPTESTTYASWHLVSEVQNDRGTIPIGRPIANTELYIVDRHLQPVPIGVAGQLLIGGEGLA